jgi:tRNA threonylcarbamoyl adenosine modification protein (Sua5/YciO/YrdC/YwlC family)
MVGGLENLSRYFEGRKISERCTEHVMFKSSPHFLPFPPRYRIFLYLSMILYPTETTYGLGVNVLDQEKLEKLYLVKGRDSAKAVSWLVRDIADIERYAEMSDVARKIAEQFLPGPLTLVLPLKSVFQYTNDYTRDTVGFRISSDSHAQALITRFMSEHDAPLSATSANISGLPTLETVGEILDQFGEQAPLISKVIDGGVRNGTPSTVVRVEGEVVEVLREGAISEEAIQGIL